jgi:hypothetical protein
VAAFSKIERIGTSPPESVNIVENSQRNSEEILVDTEFDGFRYLLVRFPKPTGSARVTLSPREQEIVRMVAEATPIRSSQAC